MKFQISYLGSVYLLAVHDGGDNLRCPDLLDVISTGRPIAEVARESGLNPKTVNRWVPARKGQGAPTRAAQDAELGKAQRRIRELEMENEFLKKFQAFLAHDNA